MAETMFVLEVGEQFLVMDLDGSVKRYKAEGYAIERMDPTGQFLVFEEDDTEESHVQALRRKVLDIHKPSQDGSFCEGCWQAGGEDGAPGWPCETAKAIGVTLEVARPRSHSHE